MSLFVQQQQKIDNGRFFILHNGWSLSGVVNCTSVEPPTGGVTVKYTFPTVEQVSRSLSGSHHLMDGCNLFTSYFLCQVLRLAANWFIEGVVVVNTLPCRQLLSLWENAE